VEKLLFGLNKQEGSTLVIVTHDIDLAKKCDMQIYIKDGKVAKITNAVRKEVRS
jgi:putative ABC transport system ATP-binding protein